MRSTLSFLLLALAWTMPSAAQDEMAMKKFIEELPPAGTVVSAPEFTRLLGEYCDHVASDVVRLDGGLTIVSGRNQRRRAECLRDFVATLRDRLVLQDASVRQRFEIRTEPVRSFDRLSNQIVKRVRLHEGQGGAVRAVVQQMTSVVPSKSLDTVYVVGTGIAQLDGGFVLTGQLRDVQNTNSRAWLFEDERLLVTALADGEVRLYPATLPEAAVPPRQGPPTRVSYVSCMGHTRALKHVALTATDTAGKRTLTTVSVDGTIRQWEATGSTCTETKRFEQAVSLASVAGIGINLEADQLSIVRLATGESRPVRQCNGCFAGMRPLHLVGGERLYALRQCAVYEIDLAKGVITAGDSVASPKLDTAAANPAAGRGCNPTQQPQQQPNYAPVEMAVSSDDRILAYRPQSLGVVTTDPARLALYDLKEKRFLGSIPLQASSRFTMSFLPGSTYDLVVAGDHELSQWRLTPQ